MADASSRSGIDPAGTPLVTVVIPTHNRAELLVRAVRSVLAQTYQNLDILVVDDASTDDTSAVIARFSDPRIRYIRHDKNKGGAAARNTGIQASSGQYIAFLDDDDEWEPAKTAEQLRLLDDYVAVLCAYSMSDAFPVHNVQNQSKPTVDLAELRRGFDLGGSSSAVIARAQVLRKIQFDETLPKCQDWDLCIRLAQEYPIGYLNKPLVRYNDGDHNRISNKAVSLSLPEMEESQLRMLHKHREFFGQKWFRWHMARMLLYGIRHRNDRIAFALAVAKKYGIIYVTRILLSRFWQRATNKLLARLSGSGAQ